MAQATAGTSSPAGAASAAIQPSERARLLARQQELQAAFDAEAAACRSRFVVTPCLEDVAKRRRLALQPLHERLLQLDEAERRERAQARREAVAARLAERERQQAAAAAQAASAATPAPRKPMWPRAPVGASAPAAVPESSRAQAREQAAAQRAVQAQQRAAAAAERQARVQQRLKERQAANRPVQPLPPAPAASRPASQEGSKGP